MKFLISILVAMTYQLSSAENKDEHAKPEAKAEHHEEGKAHKDWNEVFKQPETNQNLSTIPTQTKILEPGFLAQVKGTEVTLKWQAVEGVKYHLQVATDPNFKWLVKNEPLVDYTEYALKELQPNQQYFWRVYTQKPGNMAAYTKSPAAGSSFETAK